MHGAHMWRNTNKTCNQMGARAPVERALRIAHYTDKPICQVFCPVFRRVFVRVFGWVFGQVFGHFLVFILVSSLARWSVGNNVDDSFQYQYMCTSNETILFSLGQ